MVNPNPIKYSDLIQPDSAVVDLIAQLTSLIDKYGELKTSVQKDAENLRRSLQGVSGATEENREQITLALKKSEELAEHYRKLTDEEREKKRTLLALNQAKREQQQIDKLLIQLSNSAEGSYNRLSAQYRLNKIRLNEMSAEERNATKAGRELEAETKAIYEQMNRMQKATGKAQLQVGQYERALGGAVGVNTQFIEVLVNGEKRTQAFHGIMNAILSPIGAFIGLLGAGVGAFKLWNESAHSTQTTGDALDREVAGWAAAWERLQKSIATVNFAGFIEGCSRAVRAGRELRDVLDEAFERSNSTRLLRASMSAENAALEEAFRNTALSYDERIKAGEAYIENMRPIYEQEVSQAKAVRDARLKYLFEQSNAQKYTSEEERAAAQEAFAEQIKNYEINRELWQASKDYLQTQQTIEQGYKDMAAAGADAFSRTFAANKIEEAKARLATYTDDVKQFASIVQQYNLTNDKQVAEYVEAEERYLTATAASYNEQRRFITGLNNLKAQRANGEQKTSAVVVQSVKKEKTAVEDLAEAQAQEEADRIRAEQAEIARQKALLQAKIQSIQLEIAVTEEGTQEMLDLRIKALEAQKAAEVYENSTKDEEMQQDRLAIEAKYDKQIADLRVKYSNEWAQQALDDFNALKEAEFEGEERNERERTVFRLEMERERLRKILELNQLNGQALTDLQRQTLQQQIDNIDKVIKSTPYNNLYEVLGLSISKEKQDAIKTTISTTVGYLQDIINAYEQTAAAAKRSADERVSAAQKALDAEIEARNQGYASNVEGARRELALAQQSQEEALREQQKYAKAMELLNTAEQASSLITASANIWKAFSGISVVGPGLAAAAIATMFASFAASKVLAFSAAGKSEQYGDGTVELLEGGSHASGHDIDLGTKKDGTRRRAEGGEFFAVINKRNSRRYRNVIPDVINAFNDGTFAEKYQRAGDVMARTAVLLSAGGSNVDISRLERDVHAMRTQGEESRIMDGRGNMIVKYKNLTRRTRV